MKPIRKVALTKEGRAFYITDTSVDFHTEYGFVSKNDMKKTGLVTTNLNKELFLIPATFIDMYKKISRGPQIMIPKDIARIIAETGMNKASKVVDAGCGSGALSLLIASVAQKVISYEIRKDFHALAESNRKLLNIENLTIKNKDITKGITEKNVDIITLDLPEPWHIIPHARQSLKIGGFLVSYLPTVNQVQQCVLALDENFIHLKTVETIEREWTITDRILRPKSQPIGHTGFLTFARRVS